MGTPGDIHATQKKGLRAVPAAETSTELDGPFASSDVSTRVAARDQWVRLLFGEERGDPSRIRRILIAVVLALFIHAFFLVFIAPRLWVDQTKHRPTEVVQISQDELKKMKEAILRNNKKGWTLKDEEMHQQFKTKETPKDAEHSGPHNQTVPRETVVGITGETENQGGGGRDKEKFKMKLSQLGLGDSVPMPSPSESAVQGPQGRTGPYRPRNMGKTRTGDQNLLNAAETEFYSFFRRLDDPLVRNWVFLERGHENQIAREIMSRKVAAGAELIVGLEFTFDRHGNFTSIRIVQSSGIPTLDWTVKEAVRKLGTIPNPPPALFEGKPDYTRTLGFALILPPDRPVYMERPDLYW